MTYLQAQAFLNSFINYEQLDSLPYKRSFKLERVEKLLYLLGNPHRDMRIIHIAGTKGKGSTCAFAANILRAANYKVGLYTSPHLVDVRERIRILQGTENEMIRRRDFAGAIERVKPHAEKLKRANLGKLSFFEILTVCAFLYFREQKCDFVVLETGIGGRLDATNVASSLVCAITPISYEHMHILGATLEEIAAEKAGIIKSKKQKAKSKWQKIENITQIVITAPQRPTAQKIIRKQVKKAGAVLFDVGKDIRIEKRHTDSCGQLFDIKGILADYPDLKIDLLGEHQLINVATAIASVESLHYFGIDVSVQAIRAGLKKTQWPGRLQQIAQRPRIVLDGAQNRASALALKEAVISFFKFRKLILVLGVSQHKDIRGILQELLPLSSQVILTKSRNPRAMPPKIIKSFIQTNKRPVVLTEDSAQALKLARANAGQNDLVLVCGSLFLVGEILEKYGKN